MTEVGLDWIVRKRPKFYRLLFSRIQLEFFKSFFAVNVETMEQLYTFYSCLFFAVLSSGNGLALDGYDLLCPKNDLAFITSEVRRCEQVGRD